MRTNIVLDDATVRQAMTLTGLPTKRAVVQLALDELVQRRQRVSLAELRGAVSFAEDYDYKALRTGAR